MDATKISPFLYSYENGTIDSVILTKHFPSLARVEWVTNVLSNICW